jgi:hypothetical protein
MGFWIANVIGHPTYQAMLARRAAGSVLPRLRLLELRALRVPEPPKDTERLVAEWTSATHDLAAATSDVRALQAKVDAFVEADSPRSPTPIKRQFYSSAAVTGSLLPVQVALASFRADADRRGWRLLADFLSDDSERLRGRRLGALRVLRLSDTEGAFGFALPGLTELAHPSFRIYADPLEPDEVLLSVLGSSSKVIFNHPACSATIWIADHWARLKSQPEPGALAMLLKTGSVAAQLSVAATGAARQFIPRAELSSVRLPWPEATLRRKWQADLSAALERVHHATDRLTAIRRRVSELVDQCLRGDR